MPGIVNSMLPWLMFPVFLDWTDRNYSFAALIALGISLCLSALRLKDGYVVDWTVVTSISLTAVVGLVMSEAGLLAYWPLFMPAALMCMCWASLALGRPFTIQYAKKETPKEFWGSAIFKQVNVQISTVWGICFTLTFILSLLAIPYQPYWPLFVIAKYLLILSAMVFSRVLPEFLVARLEAQVDA
ncbi:hypothetical protein BXY66_0332 [Shimia isoporae]|uniref:Intracellular septation protein A n=1 Tax=Shimia isoporae TaxID=647720 RepID=A0A4R1NJ79_9RHOB|nr:hypothetical protein [Shimia isoporae]TCL08297.1 hypothetical protein BXY66_0332 [Shimia isoporae]